MGRARRQNEPVKRPGTRSRASAAKRIEQVRNADERAAHRYRVATFAQSVGGSLNEKLASVAEAVEDGRLTGPVPSRATLHLWLRKLDGSVIGERDFADRPRSGRPRKQLHPEVIAFIERRIATTEDLSTRRLTQDAARYAREEGWPVPSVHAVRRYMEDADPALIAALRHGSRSAILDGMVSGTVPTDAPHHSWTLDEATLPIKVRVWDRLTKIWRVVKPDVVSIIDNHSRAMVSWHIADPGRRGRKAGFDKDDVLATLWSAAIPELAPDSTRDFAGFLPQTLRWDRAPVHRPLVEYLEERGVRVPLLPGQMPKARGRVERPVDTIKALCNDITGYEGRWQVAEETTKDGRTARTNASAGRERVSAKMTIAADDLLTIEELRKVFDEKVIRRYNSVEEHTRLGTTPENAYFESFNEKYLRPGRDVLGWSDPVYNTVTKEGLVHRGVTFAPEVNQEPFKLGDRIEFRPDPLLRGVFVQHQGHPVFIQTKQEWARTNDPEEFARKQRGIARFYSDLGHEIREQHRFEVLGPDGIARAEEAEQEAIKQAGKSAYQRRKASQEQAEAERDAARSPEPRADSNKKRGSMPKTDAKSPEPVIAEPLVAQSGSRRSTVRTRRGIIADPRQMIRLVK